jgi:hypothetical protein
MIVTARQLEDMQKAGGGGARIVLPYRAKLTPLAMDFVRARKIELGYSDTGSTPSSGTPEEGGDEGTQLRTQNSELRTENLPSSYPFPGVPGEGTGSYLWWTDGPAGPAKAAVTAEERYSPFGSLAVTNDEANLINAIRAISREIKSGKISGAVLLVKNAARAALFANRCPNIRAVLGTCMETVEQGVEQIAANVLIIEYPYKTLSQIRNLLTRFLRPARKLSSQLEQQLKELASCG